MIVESNSRYRHVDDVPFQKTVSELGNVNIHMLSAGRSIPLVILTPTECCLRQMRVESPRGYSKGHLLERVLGVQGLRSEACNMECMCIADFIDEKTVVDASIGNIWDARMIRKEKSMRLNQCFIIILPSTSSSSRTTHSTHSAS